MKKEERKKLKGRIYLLPIFLLVVVLVALQIWIANRLSTWGMLVEKYEKEADWFALENQKLENKILSFSSLSRIASDSAHLAFGKQKVFYLPYPVVVAMGRNE